MVVRMIEYDFAIALEDTLRKGQPYKMEFPASCVLYLRHTKATPDTLSMEVILPNDTSLADLLKGLGVGEEVINEAMSALREKRSQATLVEEE